MIWLFPQKDEDNSTIYYYLKIHINIKLNLYNQIKDKVLKYLKT